MGNLKCLRLNLIFATFFVAAMTYTCWGSPNISASAGCSKQERLSLLKFKNTIADDFGMLSSWVGNDCCRWIGVHCDNTSGSHVVGLNLKGNYDHFDIPLFPSDLPPVKPHFLSSLRVLDLSISNSLQLLLMADDMSWVSGLSSLQHLILTQVDLSGARNRGMVLYKIPSLIELRLGDCGVTIADLGAHYDLSITLPNLQHLDLSQMTDSLNYPNKTNIPDPESLESLGKLTNLRVLRLTSNRLAGPIPEALGRLRYLEVFNLSSNQLHGPIPTFLGQLMTIFDLSNNQLNGSIPASLGRLTALTDLHLESNRLTGPIPASLGNLSSLKVFSLSSNLINGNIPLSIGKFTKLVSFDVSNNSLDGAVSETHLVNLSMLKYLDISYNSMLMFQVSRDWIPPFQLRSIRLSSCKLVDQEFPQWLRTQMNLEELVMSNANISGPLPRWLQKMSIIRSLDLSHNKLTWSLRNLPLAVYLDRQATLLLQDNLFNGSIPTLICSRQDLSVLNLSRNRLTDKLPNCLGNLSLSALLISSNELSGIVPDSIGTSGALWIKPDDNYFTGELPRDIWNSHFLQVLDVGENEFSGVLPDITGNEFLKVVRLHNNNFTGSIPASWCNSSYLHILDVARNSLTGPIPRCFGELSSMVDAKILASDGIDSEFDASVIQVIKGFDLEYTKTLKFVTNMDLSSNQLTGEIPQELTSLILLIGLNLSHNHLSGNIPQKIGNMKALNSLDFSANELSGMIPPSISDLNFLSYLNLSHNNLSGRIPTGNQLQTFTDQPSIYTGNRDLCGAPLPRNCSNPDDPPTIISQPNFKLAEEPKKVWFYLDILSGFATGFWGIVVVLVFKKRWRKKLFMFSERTMDKIYIAVVVRVAKLKGGNEAK
uniref:receptor-like protein EIX2 n=1 Tax=Erigeron canadensis TaxID=72917 RepID=UPI001CB9AF5C|nr:receptor-like protein EIX2 [Erigeron canadensis]